MLYIYNTNLIPAADTSPGGKVSGNKNSSKQGSSILALQPFPADLLTVRGQICPEVCITWWMTIRRNEQQSSVLGLSAIAWKHLWALGGKGVNGWELEAWQRLYFRPLTFNSSFCTGNKNTSTAERKSNLFSLTQSIANIDKFMTFY